MLDDAVLGNQYPRRMGHVYHMWLVKYPTVFEGIDLLTLNRTDDERHLPCNYRIFEKPNNDKANSFNFGSLIDTAKERGYQAECVLFDGSYSSQVNL